MHTYIPTYIHTYINRQPVWVHLLSYVLCLQQVAVSNCSVIVVGVFDHCTSLLWLPRASSTYIAAVPQKYIMFLTSPKCRACFCTQFQDQEVASDFSASSLVSCTRIHTHLHTYFRLGETHEVNNKTCEGRFVQYSDIKFCWPSCVLSGCTWDW